MKFKWVKRALTFTMAFSMLMSEAAVSPLQVYAASEGLNLEAETLDEAEVETPSEEEKKEGAETPSEKEKKEEEKSSSAPAAGRAEENGREP